MTLKSTADQLGELEPFEETHYAPLSEEERALVGYSGATHALPLYYYPPVSRLVLPIRRAFSIRFPSRRRKKWALNVTRRWARSPCNKAPEFKRQ